MIIHVVVLAALCLARLVMSQIRAPLPKCSGTYCLDPSDASKCYQASGPKTGSNYMYLNGKCYEKKLINFLFYKDTCWEKRPNWYYCCGFCYATKGQECTCYSCSSPWWYDPGTKKCYTLQDKKVDAQPYRGDCWEKKPDLLPYNSACWEYKKDWLPCNSICYAKKQACQGC
jgi:hypothetical protein